MAKIKEIQETLKNIIQNTDIVLNSQCSVLTQSNTFHTDLANAVNTDIGFCFAILFNSVKYTGVGFDNTDMPPKAEYSFTISLIHKNEYDGSFKDPLEMLDDMLRIHNTQATTTSGKNISIKLTETPVAFIIAQPYNIFEIEINVLSF